MAHPLHPMSGWQRDFAEFSLAQQALLEAAR
jgi:hypothetical protein